MATSVRPANQRQVTATGMLLPGLFHASTATKATVCEIFDRRVSGLNTHVATVQCPVVEILPESAVVSPLLF